MACCDPPRIPRSAGASTQYLSPVRAGSGSHACGAVLAQGRLAARGALAESGNKTDLALVGLLVRCRETGDGCAAALARAVAPRGPCRSETYEGDSGRRAHDPRHFDERQLRRPDGPVMSAAFAPARHKNNAITGAMSALIEAFDTAERDPEIALPCVGGKGGRFYSRKPTSAIFSRALHERGEFRGSVAVRQQRSPRSSNRVIAAIEDAPRSALGRRSAFIAISSMPRPKRVSDACSSIFGLVPSRLLAPCAAALGRAMASELLLLPTHFGGRSGALSSASSTLSASEQADGACDDQGGRAPAKPALPSSRRAAIMRGDPRVAQGSDGGRDARLQTPRSVPRGARGVPVVSVRGSEVAANFRHVHRCRID